MKNQIEFQVYGRYARFTDPMSNVGGEKCSYHVPTYEALKGIAKSIYWKPTFIWVIDEVRVMKRIKTQEYPGVEYVDFPLPPDYLVKHEWTRARLKYSSILSLHEDRDGFDRFTVDYPRSDRHFLAGIRRLTKIDTSSVEQIVELDGTNDIFNWPALYSVEPGYWNLDQKEADQLRDYLLRGGFLWIDDWHGTQDIPCPHDDNCKEWANWMISFRKIFPDEPIIEIPNSDPIFHTLYDLNDRFQVPGGQSLQPPYQTYEHEGKVPHWYGVYDSSHGRIMMAMTFNADYGDAFEMADEIRYPEKYVDLAYRLGINYYIYSLTH